MTGEPAWNEQTSRRDAAESKAGWTTADVAAVCREAGVLCAAARGGGSHYKIAHPSQSLILTVPYKRPIKPIYIRKLVAFVDASKGAP